MYAKNFLTTIHSIEFQNKYNIIIEQFIYANKKGITNVSISFFLNNTKMSSRILYEKIHELLELNLVYKKEYSVCPNCQKENIIDRNLKNKKCSRCGIYYVPTYIVERFKINRVLIDEESL